MTVLRPAVPFHTRLYYRIVQSGRYVDKEYSGNILKRLAVIFAVITLVMLFSTWWLASVSEEKLPTYISVVPVLAPSIVYLTLHSIGIFYRERIKRDADLLHYVLPYTYLNSHPEIDRATYKDAWVRVPLPLERKALLMQALIPLKDAVHNSITDDDLTLMAALAGDYQQIPQWIEYEEIGW